MLAIRHTGLYDIDQYLRVGLLYGFHPVKLKIGLILSIEFNLLIFRLINNLAIPILILKLKTAPGTLIAAISKWLFVCGLLCVLFYPSVVKAQKDYTVRNGETVTIDPFPATGCVYKWTNDNPGIGMPASGSGDINAFKAINGGFNVIKAKISVSTVPVPPRGYGYANRVLSILNLTTAAAEEAVPVPNGVYMGMNPNGNELYAIDNTDPKKLYVVSTASNKVLSVINLNVSLAATPAALMMTPDGSKIYVFNNTTTPLSLTLIHTDTRTSEVINLPPTITATNYNHHAAMSDDGKQIYVSNDTPGKDVWVYDTQTDKVIATIPVTRPGELFPAAGGKKLYILTGDAGKFYSYDFTTSKLTQLSIGTTGYGVFPTRSPDHKLIYVKAYDGYGYTNLVVNTDNDNITKIDENFPGGLIFSPDGKYYYSVTSSSGNVTVMNTADNTVAAKIPVNASDGGNTTRSSSSGQLSYDGSTLYVTNNVYYTAIGSLPTGYNNVTVIDTKTNTIIKTVPVGSYNVIRAVSNGACNTTPYTFTVTVNPDPAVINTTGTVAALSTTYGTPSSAGNFNASGSKIGGGILVTAPADFEVSTDNVTFGNTATVTAPVSGDVPATKIYIRLKLTANVGTHSGNVTLSNNGIEVTVPVPISTVSRAGLTIKPGIITKTYGATLSTTSGLTTFVATGLKNGETIGSVTLTYSAGAKATDVTGSYPGSVTLSGPVGGTFSADNYTISTTTGDATVVPAPLTITADNKSRLVDEENPILTFTYSGFVNNEGPGILTSQPLISTTATRSSTAGIYPITLSGASAPNYTMVYKAGNMTVLPRNITVSNTFTPNGDGINDTWEIKYIYLYPKCTVEVYNRNGNKILYSLGYPTAWDGKYNGTALQTGTYYYIVNLNNGTKPVTGSITIIR